MTMPRRYVQGRDVGINIVASVDGGRLVVKRPWMAGELLLLENNDHVYDMIEIKCLKW